MKKLLKIIYIIIAIICISLTFYYYIYLGMIVPRLNWGTLLKENKENIKKEPIYKEVLVKEETFTIKSLIEDYLSKEDNKNRFLSENIKQFIDNETIMDFDFRFEITNQEQIHKILSSVFKNIENIRKNNWNNRYLIENKDFIEISWEQKAIWLYEAVISIKRDWKIIFNGTFIIDSTNWDIYIKEIKNLDIYLNFINIYWLERFYWNSFTINYKPLNNIFIWNNLDKKWYSLDMNFGKSNYKNYYKIISSIEEFYKRKFKENSSLVNIDINKDLKTTLIWQIFDKHNISIWQKQNINDKVGYLIDLLDWTNIKIYSKFIKLKNNKNTFITNFDLSLYKTDTKKVSELISREEYIKLLKEDILKENKYQLEKIDSLWKNFIENNKLLYIYLNDISITDVL